MEEQNEKGRQRQVLVHCSLAPQDLMLILLHEGTRREE